MSIDKQNGTLNDGYLTQASGLIEAHYHVEPTIVIEIGESQVSRSNFEWVPEVHLEDRHGWKVPSPLPRNMPRLSVPVAK